jgi:hypothetical protein
LAEDRTSGGTELELAIVGKTFGRGDILEDVRPIKSLRGRFDPCLQKLRLGTSAIIEDWDLDFDISVCMSLAKAAFRFRHSMKTAIPIAIKIPASALRIAAREDVVLVADGCHTVSAFDSTVMETFDLLGIANNKGPDPTPLLLF